MDGSLQAESLLGLAATQVERGFLAAGESLERADGILQHLTDRFAAFVAELTDGTLEGAGSGLGAAGAQVTQLATARAADRSTLASLAGVLARVSRRVGGLQPLTREVEVLAVTARVVAGGMGATGADFLSFSASIQAAARHARADLQTLQSEIGALERDLGIALGHSEQFAREHGQAMHDIPERLARNQRNLADRHGLAGDAAAQARSRSDAMGRQVAEQISALQLGDIARQRLEHVRDALAAARDTSRARSGLLPTLLTAQLNDTAGELEREGGRIETGLAGLAGMAAEIGRLGTEIHSASEGSGAFVSAVEADLKETASLFGELRQADADTDRCMGMVLAAAGELAGGLDALQSVEEDIRIIGLNATLKCGRLGAVGRPLSAVAQELRGSSARFAAEAVAALDDVARLRGIASGLRDPARQAKHAALAEAMESMLSALKRLGALEAELAASLDDLHRHAEQVTGLLEAAISQFAVRHRVIEIIRGVADAIAPAPSEAAPAGPDPAEQALLDHIAAGYTMAREREVHARFAPLPKAVEASGAATDDIADVFF
jgi:hypothetical protein